MRLGLEFRGFQFFRENQNKKGRDFVDCKFVNQANTNFNFVRIIGSSDLYIPVCNLLKRE